jgi:hypothetical protein
LLSMFYSLARPSLPRKLINPRLIFVYIQPMALYDKF